MHAPQRMQRSIASHVAAEKAAAAAVDEDDVKMLGTFDVVGSPRPGGDRNVVRDRLRRCRARQQAQQRRDVFERRHDFFDAGDRDVHARQRRHHAAVAFVGDDQRRAGLGDEEVGAGDAHVAPTENAAAAPRALRGTARR